LIGDDNLANVLLLPDVDQGGRHGVKPVLDDKTDGLDVSGFN